MEINIQLSFVKEAESGAQFVIVNLIECQLPDTDVKEVDLEAEAPRYKDRCQSRYIKRKKGAIQILKEVTFI